MTVEDLAAWVRENGGLISGVEVRELSSGDRGLFAVRDLHPGETILQLPPNILITGERARSAPHVSGVLKAIDEDRLEETIAELANCDRETVAIVLYLVAEVATGNNSLWQPWIDSLPKEFYTPITAPKTRIQANLCGTTILAFASEIKDELEVLFHEFIVPYAVERFPDAYPRDTVTFDLFLWAYSVSESRSFERRLSENAQASGRNRGTLLTPYADMMNHSCHAHSVSAIVKRWRPVASVEDSQNIESGFEACIGPNPVAKDSQIFISYGQVDNARLLTHYGFAIPQNPHDRVSLTLAIPEDECNQLTMKKLLLLELAQGGSLGTDYELGLSDPLPVDLLASLRLLSMTAAESESVTVRTNFYEKISSRNEQSVRDTLEGILEVLTPSPSRNHADSQCSSGWKDFDTFCDIYSDSLREIIAASKIRLRKLNCDS